MSEKIPILLKAKSGMVKDESFKRRHIGHVSRGIEVNFLFNGGGCDECLLLVIC